MMAKALIKYETIDDEQIKDIMDGREPRPPADWDETDPTSSGGKPPESELGSTIGGPASEH
jgi:cell division protease FtsH